MATAVADQQTKFAEQQEKVETADKAQTTKKAAGKKAAAPQAAERPRLDFPILFGPDTWLTVQFCHLGRQVYFVVDENGRKKTVWVAFKSMEIIMRPDPTVKPREQQVVGHKFTGWVVPPRYNGNGNGCLELPEGFSGDFVLKYFFQPLDNGSRGTMAIV